MAVNLSPVAGAAAQFFDNSGQVLTGGKLYTYDAGTTTPAPTYTSSSGVTAQPNPIILNAAGRVPDSGEIWLSDSVSYKFILKDQNDVLIGTYDNLVGINSNFVNFTGEEETQTATQGQTVFTLATLTYQPSTNNLLVFVNGSKQVLGTNFTETSSTVVTFVDGLNVGDVVDFCTATPINSNIATAASVSFTGFKGQTGNVQNLASSTGSDWIGFLPSGTSAVARSAQDKMRDTVSVKDFGAIGNGIADDTTAIQNAHNASRAVYYPTGTYKVTSISLPSGAIIIGEGASSSGSTTTNNTTIVGTTSAYVYTMYAPVPNTNIIEGPRFSNINIQCQNGVQLNDSTKGSPDLSGTQGIIFNASFRRVFISNNGTLGTGTGIQASVCFHMEVTEQCEIQGFNVNLDMYYGDLLDISYNRLWQFGTANIRLTLQAGSTYGNAAWINNNDLLYGLTSSTAHIVSNWGNPDITENFIEQFASQGTGMTAAIKLNDGSNGLHSKIDANYVTFPLGVGANWLSVTTTGTDFDMGIYNNTITTGGTNVYAPAIFNGGSGIQLWQSSGATKTVLSHHGNSIETGIPLNTIAPFDMVCPAYKTVSVMTPNISGAITNANYALTGYVQNNQFTLPPSSGGNVITFQDPRYNLLGTFTINVLAYASAAQSLNWQALDNGITATGGTISVTTNPKWFQLTASQVIATNLGVLFQNLTSGGANSVYIQSVVITTV